MISLLFAFIVVNLPLSGLAQTRAPLVCQPAGVRGDCDLFKDSCSQVADETLRDFSSWVETKTSQLYAGKNVVFTTGAAGLDAFPVGSVVCNPASGELRSNHLGQACGETIQITRSGGQYIGNRGTLESSYKLGAFVAGAACVAEQLKGEVRQGAIQVSADCQPIAQDLAALMTRGATLRRQLMEQAQVAGLSSNLCSQRMLQDFRGTHVPDWCRSLASEPDTTAAGVMKYQQAACYLKSSGEALKAAYKNLLQCEHTVRLEKSYTAGFLGPDSKFEKEFLEGEVDAAVDSNARSAIRACMRRLKLSTSCAYGRATAGVQRWYDARIGPYAADFIRRIYPEGGQCYSP